MYLDYFIAREKLIYCRVVFLAVNISRAQRFMSNDKQVQLMHDSINNLPVLILVPNVLSPIFQ